MSSDLPSEFDVVVLGTGMPESILAAAFSRIGKSVLHLDRNPYYSGDWASFNLQGIEKWTQQIQGNLVSEETVRRPDVDESSLLEEGETLVQLPLTNTHFSQTQLQYFVRSIPEKSEAQSKVSKPADQSSIPDKEIESTKSAHDSETDQCGSYESSSKSESEGDGKSEHVETSQVERGISGLDIEEKSVDANPQNITDAPDSSKDTTVGESEMTKVNAEEPCQDALEDGYKEITGDNEQTPDTAKAEEVSTVDSETSNSWTREKMQADWRRFNLDLSPKVVYSGGDMVELLITSDIAKYCEFKTVTRLLTLMNGAIEQVPCSRADVFSSKKLSMLEKRMLMKFLQSCVQCESNSDQFKEYLDKPFTQLLSSWKPKLTSNIQFYIQHSIAMATDSTTTAQALEQMKKFFKSLGRYGNTAFLWSLYGSGELPQSFCRLCAVFGGTYILNMTASSLLMDNKEKRCTGVITTGGQKIKCKWLVMESSYAPQDYIQTENQRHISRAILLTNKPLLSTDKQELSLMTIPCPNDGDRPVLLLELPPSSMASPKGVYVFHLTRLSSSTSSSAAEELSDVVNTLFTTTDTGDDDRPAILWSVYFSQLDMSSPKKTDQVPDNVILMSGPGTDFDLDRPVQEAKSIFQTLLPDEEFLPKAPNPEDIIYVDDNTASVSEGSERVEYTDSAANGGEGENKSIAPGETGGDNSASSCETQGDNSEGSRDNCVLNCEPKEDNSVSSTDTKGDNFTAETDNSVSSSDTKLDIPTAHASAGDI